MTGNPLEPLSTTSHGKPREGSRLMAEPDGKNLKGLANLQAHHLSARREAASASLLEAYGGASQTERVPVRHEG